MAVLGRLRGEVANPPGTLGFPPAVQPLARSRAWGRFASPAAGLAVGFLAGAFLFGLRAGAPPERPPSQAIPEPEWLAPLLRAVEELRRALEASSKPSGTGEWAPAAASRVGRVEDENGTPWEHKVVVLSPPPLDAGDPGKEQWLQFTDLETLLRKEESQGWTLVEAIPRGSRVGLVLRRAR